MATHHITLKKADDIQLLQEYLVDSRRFIAVPDSSFDQPIQRGDRVCINFRGAAPVWRDILNVIHNGAVDPAGIPYTFLVPMREGCSLVRQVVLTDTNGMTTVLWLEDSPELQVGSQVFVEVISTEGDVILRRMVTSLLVAVHASAMPEKANVGFLLRRGTTPCAAG